MQRHKIIYLFIACLMLLPVEVQAKDPAGLVKQGNAAFSAGKYDAALKAYDEAAVDVPESPQIHFNVGAAYYQKGDYAKAKDAWEKAALTSKDITLEAKADFNLGNCAYQEAKRQQDSDLKKAIDACTQSIGYYQQAVDLLQNQKTANDASLKKEAAENLEMVRLVMKSILDEIAKQEQKAKQYQQAANDLKKLIKKQQELIDRNQYAADEKKQSGETPQLNDKISQMSADQAQLRKETLDVAKKLPKPDPKKTDPKKPDPAKAAKKHLDQAQILQKSAAEKINDGQLDDAKKNQENALQELKNALDSMKKPKGQNQKKQSVKDQKAKSTQAQNQKNDQKKEGQKKQESPNSKPENKDNNARVAAQQTNTAKDILNEEKENRKNRRPAVSGGYRKIDKDW
ncbi:MAG: tetratricopeptide repeat protein [Dissulfuribacterales bacterium]